MKPMTPSQETVEMTDGQVDKGADILRAKLRKHRKEFKENAVQLALGSKELGLDLLAVFRKHVEKFSNLIVRIVPVDRNRTPEAVINATGRRQYVDSGVVTTMPRGEGGETKVTFFKLSRCVSDDNLEKEYATRGLKPDPYAQAAVNEADPAFADEHPNGTHWKGPDGKWHFVTFNRWPDERSVDVSRSDYDWGDCWWFGGVAS